MTIVSGIIALILHVTYLRLFFLCSVYQIVYIIPSRLQTLSVSGIFNLLRSYTISAISFHLTPPFSSMLHEVLTIFSDIAFS